MSNSCHSPLKADGGQSITAKLPTESTKCIAKASVYKVKAMYLLSCLSLVLDSLEHQPFVCLFVYIALVNEFEITAGYHGMCCNTLIVFR